MTLLKKEWFQITILLLVFLTLLYIPLAAHIIITPPGRIYLGAEKYYPDYYSIISLMSQGAMGGWVIKDTETLKDSSFYLVHIEYITLGKLAHALNIPSYVFYFISKIIVSTLIFLFLYKAAFLLNLNRASRFLMVTAGLFLSSPPIFPNFYRPPDSFNLFTHSLHHEIGILGGLIMLVLFLLYKNSNSKKYIFFLFCTALVTGVVQSTESILISLSLFLSAPLLIFIKIVNKKNIFKVTFIALAFIFFLILPAVFYKIIFNLNPALKGLGTNFENAFAIEDLKATSHQVIFSFFFHLAPFSLLSFPIIKIFKKLSPLQKISAVISLAYIVSFITMYLVGFYFLGISRIRFNITAFPFAFAVLIGLSFSQLRNLKIFKYLIFTLFLFSSPAWFSSIKQDVLLFGNPPRLDENAYPKKDIIDGVLWMKNLPFGKVLSQDHVGQFLLGLGNQMFYLNSISYTNNYFGKINKATTFYEGQMSPVEAKKFLSSERINYIFLGPYESKVFYEPDSLSFLKKIYENPKVKIYKVEN